MQTIIGKAFGRRAVNVFRQGALPKGGQARQFCRVTEQSSGTGRVSSWRLAAGGAARASDIAILVDEIQELVVALDRVRNQHFSLAFARLGLLADVALAIEEIEILLVIPFQIQLLNLFSHGSSPPEIGFLSAGC